MRYALIGMRVPRGQPRMVNCVLTVDRNPPSHAMIQDKPACPGDMIPLAAGFVRNDKPACLVVRLLRIFIVQ